MKKLKLILPLLVGMLLLASLQSCTDNFEELNTNPSSVSPDVVNPGFLFTQAQRSAVWGIPSRDAFSGTSYSVSSGNIFNQSGGGSGLPYYTNELIAVSDMIRLTDDDEVDLNRNAMGRIWKAWLFQNITDGHGDVPYFEAALPQSETTPFPTYDTQREIYVDIMDQLKQAVEDLEDDPSRTTLGSQDLMYGGDVDSWVRFANSLRLRYALRVRFADEGLADTHIDDVIDEPLIESNAQNAFIMTKGENTPHTSNRHPLYEYVHGGSPLNPVKCSHPYVSNMEAAASADLDMDDPRLPIYCQPAPTDGEYRGRTINPREGFGWYSQNRNISGLGTRFQDVSEQPIVVIDYAEVQFNIAEAQLAGLTSGDPQAAYQAGIRASMEFYEVDEADISAFLNSSAGTLSGNDEAKLRQISTQRYISLFYQSREAWSEWRRTGYPIQYVTGAFTGHTNGQVPRRLAYPDGEKQTNAASVQEAIARLDNGDDYMSRIWWDAREGLPFTHPDAGTFPPPPDEDMTSDDVEEMIEDMELEEEEEE